MSSLREPRGERKSLFEYRNGSRAEPPRGRPKGEPLPEWTRATRLWEEAWPLHWIGMSTLFILLALLSLVTLISFIRRKRRKLGIMKFSMTILVILMILCFSRGLYLLINPYESNDCIFSINQCPLFLNRFLFGLGMPSLVSAFLLLYLALAEVTKVKGRGIDRLQNWKFLIAVVTTNYVISLSVELIVIYFANTTPLVVICHSYFMLFSVLLVIAYVRGGLQILWDSRKNRREMAKVVKGRSGGGSNNDFGPKPPDLTKVIVLTLVTSFLGLTFLGCQIYAIAAVYIDDAQVVSFAPPWPWYAYQTVYRLDEFLMACLLYFTVTFKSSGPKNRRQSGVFSSASRSIMKVFRRSRGKSFSKTTTDGTVTNSVTVELVHHGDIHRSEAPVYDDHI